MEDVVGGEELVFVNKSSPSPPPPPVASTNNQTLTDADDTSSRDPLVDVIALPSDFTAMTTPISNNAESENNFNRGPINTSGGTAGDTHNQLPDYGKPESRISSGGGGKSH